MTWTTIEPRQPGAFWCRLLRARHHPDAPSTWEPIAGPRLIVVAERPPEAAPGAAFYVLQMALVAEPSPPSLDGTNEQRREWFGPLEAPK